MANDDLAGVLGPCPFCGCALSIRKGSNPYGRCATDGCWMAERALTVPLHAKDQVAAWSTRPADPDNAALERAAKRWAGVPELIEQITAEEGANVIFTGSNPDFNGLPNEAVAVIRGPDWKEEVFRADTLIECLQDALKGAKS